MKKMNYFHLVGIKNVEIKLDMKLFSTHNSHLVIRLNKMKNAPSKNQAIFTSRFEEGKHLP